MNNIERLVKKSDEEIQAIWDAIWELDLEDRPDIEWQEDVYSEITRRELRSKRPNK